MKKNLIKLVSVGLILLLAFSLGTQKGYSASDKPILKKGMDSSYVKNLQSDLKKLGFFNSNPTGYYGDITVTAVKKFQKKYGIPATGVVATLTYNKINTLPKPPSPKKAVPKPVATKVKPAEATVKPAEVTVKPTKATDKPAEATVKPAEATDKPAEATVKPAEATDKPTEATVKLTEATDKPAEATVKPAESTDKPAESTAAQASEGLKMGMTSEAVLKLQNDLMSLGYINVSPTGNFGTITESALIQFQKNYSLDPSGIAGSDTLAVIERLLQQTASISRGGEDRVSFKPVNDIKLQLIPGLPQVPYLKGIGQYEGVVIHFTDNMIDTAQIEADYEKVHWRKAFVHEFIDPKEIIQVAAPDYKAWGAGIYANDRFIHLELCHADNQSDFDASFQLITRRAAEYLYMRQLEVIPAKADGTGTLWSHMDVSQYLGATDHQDPIAYLLKWGKSWDDVVKAVTENYSALLVEEEENNTK